LYLALSISGCPVYVMSPLDILNSNQQISYRDKLISWLDRLSAAKVDGVMIDVWWGLTETSEKSYRWNGYSEVFNLIKDRNMKIIPVFSFHLCGGNVGDTCNIPLPSFVLNSQSKPFFVDADGHVDKEYISLGFDDVKITSRTPIEMYKDWMAAFQSQFSNLISSGVISELEIGLGPAGEARYPSYQLAYWGYPGCGEFQSYDAQLTKKLKADAIAAGHQDWGHNPDNAGGYNVQPGKSQFWSDGQYNAWNTEYGRWFIKWYATQLNQHADRVLKAARQVFTGVHLSAKIAGIHWWYMTGCHCAESTAGFNNFYDYDGYRDMLTVFKRYDADVCFTCLEMTASWAGSDPPILVNQILNDAAWAGLRFEGENALPMYDYDSYNRIKGWVQKGLKAFTYLRLCDDLMQNNNFNTFANFVNNMHNA